MGNSKIEFKNLDLTDLDLTNMEVDILVIDGCDGGCFLMHSIIGKAIFRNSDLSGYDFTDCEIKRLLIHNCKIETRLGDMLKAQDSKEVTFQ